MSENIKSKLKQVEANLNEIKFSIEYKGKTLLSANLPVPSYAEEVFEDEAAFHLFFYDMSRKLKEKIDKEHQRKMMENHNGSGALREKSDQ